MAEKQGSGVLKWIGIGCGVLALIGMCFGGFFVVLGGGIFAAVEATSAPADQTKGFLADVRAHNYAAAHARMSASYRASHDVAALQAAIEGEPALTSQTDDTISNRNIMNGSATMSGFLTTPTGTVPVVAELTESNGTWQIDRLTAGATVIQ